MPWWRSQGLVFAASSIHGTIVPIAGCSRCSWRFRRSARRELQRVEWICRGSRCLYQGAHQRGLFIHRLRWDCEGGVRSLFKADELRATRTTIPHFGFLRKSTYSTNYPLNCALLSQHSLYNLIMSCIALPLNQFKDNIHFWIYQDNLNNTEIAQ